MITDIGIDARMLHHTGIGTYLKNTVEQIRDQNLLPTTTKTLFGAPIVNGAWPEFYHESFDARIYSINEQMQYKSKLNLVRIWHAPHYNAPLFKSKTRLIVTVHDLIHWIFRKEFFNTAQSLYAKIMFTNVANRADHIITVSHKTKQDIVDHFNANPDKISVTYEGASAQFVPLSSDQVSRTLLKHKIFGPYFFYIGLMKKHKNVGWLIENFKRHYQSGRIKSQLVIVGKIETADPIVQKHLTNLDSKDGIIHLPFIETEDLVALYNGAIALTHPSLYEGFGLTLLEAMKCGTPCIALRVGSIPEVMGETAGVLIDPKTPDDFFDAMIKLENSSTWRNTLSAESLNQSKLFSWAECARQTSLVYKKEFSQ